MSWCITKQIYQEKSNQQVVWNEGSIFSFDYRFIYLFEYFKGAFEIGIVRFILHNNFYEHYKLCCAFQAPMFAQSYGVPCQQFARRFH
jgi:hypothetical protein